MDLTAPLEGWIKQDEDWDRLISRLFPSLQQALAEGQAVDFESLRQGLQTWQPFIDCADERHRKQWLTAQRLLWCAERAAHLPSVSWDEIDRLRLTLQAPEEVREQEGWALDCIRLLRRVPAAAAASLQVPVALTDDMGSSRGAIATLVVETLQPGGGQSFLHPAYTLRTYAHPDFEAAMDTAWVVARGLAQASGTECSGDARWWIQLRGHPVPEVKGRSVSGAAALGWCHLLQGTVPDEGVMVLAQVDGKGHLGGVQGITAKVHALAADGRFDTIVVASEENRQEAGAALRDVKKVDQLRVVVASTLEEAYGVRSWLVDDLLAYLQETAKDLEDLPPYYPRGLSFEHIRKRVRLRRSKDQYRQDKPEETD